METETGINTQRRQSGKLRATGDNQGCRDSERKHTVTVWGSQKACRIILYVLMLDPLTIVLIGLLGIKIRYKNTTMHKTKRTPHLAWLWQNFATFFSEWIDIAELYKSLSKLTQNLRLLLITLSKESRTFWISPVKPNWIPISGGDLNGSVNWKYSQNLTDLEQFWKEQWVNNIKISILKTKSVVIEQQKSTSLRC